MIIRQFNIQGFENEEIDFLEFLNLRYEGTDTAIMTLNPSHGDSNRNDSNGPPDYVSAFVRQYKQEYGFVIEVNMNNNNNNFLKNEEPQSLHHKESIYFFHIYL